jgi:hypothetical protein
MPASQGYSFDRRQSWRGSVVMRKGAGDKVIIRLGPNGHQVYFSVRDDADNGSIIDFVQGAWATTSATSAKNCANGRAGGVLHARLRQKGSHDEG